MFLIMRRLDTYTQKRSVQGLIFGYILLYEINLTHRNVVQRIIFGYTLLYKIYLSQCKKLYLYKKWNAAGFLSSEILLISLVGN